jgi:hypothetical protein
MTQPRRGPMPPPHPAGAVDSPLLPMLVYLTVIVVAGVAVWLAGDHGQGMPAGDGQPFAAEEPASDVPAEEDAPDPTGVRIASLDIALETIPLGLEDDGSLEVPDDPYIAGWWTGGANPGERGPAVIVGHVDSYEGPGAFYGLEGIPEGERVSVDRGDGTAVHFRVERVERHPKDDFPTAAVYGQTEAPTLRLVTCAGEFDPGARSYEDNVIVFLELEGWSEAS